MAQAFLEARRPSSAGPHCPLEHPAETLRTAAPAAAEARRSGPGIPRGTRMETRQGRPAPRRRKRAKWRLFSNGVLLLLPRLGCNGAFLAHYNLRLAVSRDSPPFASQVGGITGMHHQARLIFVFNKARVSACWSGWSQTPDLRLSPASASHSVGMIGGLVLLPKLECSRTIIAHCSLSLLGSRDPPVSASQLGWSQTPGLKRFSQLSPSEVLGLRYEPQHPGCILERTLWCKDQIRGKSA
ncbi:hypothetical protein AAY473_032824, partial [Plecturocebus cupreus]